MTIMSSLEQEDTLTNQQTKLAEIHFALDRITDAPMELDARLNAVTGVIQQQLGCDVCSVYVLDPEEQQLVLRASYGLSPSAVGQAQLQMGEGVTGWVAEHLGAVALADAPTDERFKYLPETGEERFRSLLLVPIVADCSFLGVINVQHVDVHPFSDTERFLVSGIGYKVGGMIRSANQENELRSHRLGLDLLLSASEMIHDLQGSEQLHAALLAKCRQATGAAGAVLRRYDFETELLNIAHLDGNRALSGNFTPLKLGEGVAGEVAASGLTLRLNDYTTLAEKLAASRDISSSLICVPLVGTGGLVGTLSVFDKEGADEGGTGFTLHDKQLLEGVARFFCLAWSQPMA